MEMSNSIKNTLILNQCKLNHNSKLFFWKLHVLLISLVTTVNTLLAHSIGQMVHYHTITSLTSKSEVCSFATLTLL